MRPMSNRLFGWAIKSIYGNLMLPYFYRLKKDAVKYAKYNCSNHPELNYKSIYEIIKVEVVEL